MRNVSRPLNTIIKAYKMFHQENSFPSSVVERENFRLSPFIPLKKNGGKLVTCTLDTSISTRNKRLGEKKTLTSDMVSNHFLSFRFHLKFKEKRGGRATFSHEGPVFLGPKMRQSVPRQLLITQRMWVKWIIVRQDVLGSLKLCLCLHLRSF